MKEETKQKISLALKGTRTGKDNPMYGKTHAKATPINKFDLNGNLISSFKSILDAALSVDGNAGCVYLCCHKRKRTYKGFIWRFKNI